MTGYEKGGKPLAKTHFPPCAFTVLLRRPGSAVSDAAGKDACEVSHSWSWAWCWITLQVLCIALAAWRRFVQQK